MIISAFFLLFKDKRHGIIPPNAPVVKLADTMDLGDVTLVKGFCKWMNLQEDMPMGKLRKQNSNLPAFPRITPDKTETFAGKWTARVTKIFNQPDGSIIKATRKINKDGSITDKIEHRHK